MSLTNPGISVPTHPRMLDRVCIDMAGKLMDGLNWLDICYGKAEERVKLKDGKSYVYPAVFNGDEYLDMLPGAVTDSKGVNLNYGFFHFSDPVTHEYHPGLNQWIEANVSFICWFDLRRIYPEDWNVMTAENVRAEVTRFFKFPRFQTTFLRWRVQTSETKGRRVYREYSYREIDNQDLIRPNGAIRVNLWVRFLEVCPDPRAF